LIAGARDAIAQPPHRRSLGWLGTTALAMGGSNQSLFLIGALFVGQGAIHGQGSAAVPLLIIGVLLAWAALPGWTELVLLSPNRVGGIAAACTEAFAPYSSLLSALVGCCYWWGWVPTCGLTALLSAAALHAWLVPAIPTTALAIGIICVFLTVNLCGVDWAARLAVPVAGVSVLLTFLAAFVPIITGHVDWHQATTFHLSLPFGGWFGGFTSLMAGLYLIGFAAPAFEAAACHVGETVDPKRNVPRAMFASAALAGMFFIVLPVVLLGVLGPAALGRDLALELGPAFAPLFGSAAKAMAIGFMVFNMFHGTLQPLAGASRTLSQLADDGVFPRFLSRRSKVDVPWTATVVTAATAVGFLLIGDPIWLIAAANFTYLIAVCLPSVAVWLLRRDDPHRERLYRAPRGTIGLGLFAAGCWTIACIFGFEQFGLGTVILGLVFAYSGAALYAWRKLEDRKRAATGSTSGSLHLRLTLAMVTALLFDGAGYYLAIRSIPAGESAMITALQDIFVVVALLTIGVGLVLPGMIAHVATRDLSNTNERLKRGTEALQLEITERTLVEQRLLHVASHDELTGLANRALFMDRFNQMIARVQRRHDHVAAVVFLDLDRFKLVNDSLGHLVGDELLISVAARLTKSLRTGDTLARLGGDEFIFLLEDLDDPLDASAFAERILAALAPPFEIMNREIFASASIGIAVTRTGFDSAEDVLRDADIAMYEAKSLGKQRCVVFTPELLERAVGLLQLETDLKGALERAEFVVYYQPIVSLANNALLGFEALVRWRHPTRGLLTPDVFIGAAEESGAIVQLGAQVLREAVHQACIWRDEFSTRHLKMSVNVSARQFSDARLLELITSTLDEFGLSAELLQVEITESAIMANAETAAATLAALRAMGIEVKLDDFGTGYSSLGYLQQLPVDVLKIDRSFISMAGKTVGNPQIVRTVTSLAQSLSMKTTAEGIETIEQLVELRSLGCTNGQGFYFSPAVSAADAGRLIAGWAPLTSREKRLRLATVSGIMPNADDRESVSAR
jgi:diguanylate cyclase (GGDEF)-like protein